METRKFEMPGHFPFRPPFAKIETYLFAQRERSLPNAANLHLLATWVDHSGHPMMTWVDHPSANGCMKKDRQSNLDLEIIPCFLSYRIFNYSSPSFSSSSPSTIHLYSFHSISLASTVRKRSHCFYLLPQRKLKILFTKKLIKPNVYKKMLL